MHGSLTEMATASFSLRSEFPDSHDDKIESSISCKKDSILFKIIIVGRSSQVSFCSYYLLKTNICQCISCLSASKKAEKEKWSKIKLENQWGENNSLREAAFKLFRPWLITKYIWVI